MGVVGGFTRARSHCRGWLISAHRAQPFPKTVPDTLLYRQNGSACANPSAATASITRQNRAENDTKGGAAPNHHTSAEDLFHEDWPHAKFHPDRNCQLDHELRYDLDLQLNHFHCWDSDRQELLEKTYRKVTFEYDDGTPGYWNNLRQWKNYDWQATVIALSSYANRWRFCSCGPYGYSCGDPLCRRCCFNQRAEPLLNEFRRGFHHADECYYLVIGLSRESDETKRLIFKDLDQAERQLIALAGDAEQADMKDYGIKPANELEDYDLACQAIWRIFSETMHHFTGRKSKQIFMGGFGGPELSVRFTPLAVLPHANYIVFSRGLSTDDLRRFRRELSRRFRNCRRVESGLYPKVSLYRVAEPEDFHDVVKYMFKPIDVGFAYATAADCCFHSLTENLKRKPITVGQAYAMAAGAADGEGRSLKNLNQQVDCFLERLPLIFHNVRRLRRYGCCSPRSKDYIGIVTVEKEERRQADAERRAKRKAEQDEIRKIFPAYQPFKRRKTAKDREDEMSMKRWYSRLVEEGELPGKPPKRWLRKGQRRRIQTASAREVSANPDRRVGQHEDGAKSDKPGQASLRPDNEQSGSASIDHSNRLRATTSQWEGRGFAQGLRDQLESRVREKDPG